MVVVVILVPSQAAACDTGTSSFLADVQLLNIKKTGNIIYTFYMTYFIKTKCFTNHKMEAIIVKVSQDKQHVSLCSRVKLLFWGLRATENHIWPSVSPVLYFSLKTVLTRFKSFPSATRRVRSIFPSSSSTANHLSQMKQNLKRKLNRAEYLDSCQDLGFSYKFPPVTS